MYDFNDVSIKHPRSLYKWFEVSAVYLFFGGGGYRLLLGAIIMMLGVEVEGVTREGIQGEKKCNYL